MAEVRPFKGLRYSVTESRPLDHLICPPYDIISPEEQQALQRRSSYNAIHLELPEDDARDDRYSVAAQALGRWRKEGVLAQDSKPIYYLLRQRFHHRGKSMERWGLMACVRLEEFSRRIVLPHEETGAGPKEDRLKLMKACRTNFSPIMMLYRDPQHQLRSALAKVIETPPVASATYARDEEVAFWVVDASRLRDTISATFQNAQLFIADGHHRYETALAYRDLMRQQSPGWSDKDAFNYVMATLIDFDDPGLLVLPYHRTASGLSAPTLTAVRHRLQETFQIQAFPQQPTTPEALEDAVLHQEKGVSLGLLGPDGEGPYLLTLRSGAAVSKLRTLPGGAALIDSEGWVLHQAVLEPALGNADRFLSYTHDPREAWDNVVNGQQQLAFFLKPFPMDLFQAVVSTGQRLPRKSTYFQPKLPTGVVFNLLEGAID